MDDPLISVIIPVYNVEAYLARCLDSVMQSTYPCLEIICVDDGSTDGSAEILDQYKEKDARIRVFSKENGGVSSARNLGLKKATGRFIAFVDADDMVHPQLLALMLEAQRSTSADIVICGFRAVCEADLPLETVHESVCEQQIRMIGARQFALGQQFRVYCWGKLFRCEQAAKVSFRESIRYGEDQVYIGELWEQFPTMRCCAVPNKLYFYCQRENSAVNQKPEPERIKERIALEKLYLEKAAQSDTNERIYLEFSIRRLLSARYMSSWFYPDRDHVRDCNMLLRSGLRQLTASRQITGKNKLVYLFFYAFPRAYRLYRSIRDPGMRRWEKALRRSRRNDRSA